MERIRVKDETDFGDAIFHAVEILKRGGLVIYPTDTLYGMGVDAKNEEAIERVIELKERDEKKALSVIVSDVKMASEYAELSEIAHIVAKKLLPGALTLILKSKSNLPEVLTGGGNGLGIRIPDSFLCIELTKALGSPITSTSANISGGENPTDVDSILQEFKLNKEDIDLIIDIGKMKESKGSTVVDLRDKNIQIVREGEISKEEIEKVTNGNAS